MRRSFALALLFSLFVPVLVACGQKRVEALTDRAEAFSRSIRWGSLAAAGILIADDRRRTLMEQIGRSLGREKVVDYSIVDMSIDPKETQGTIVVDYSYYTIKDEQLLSREEIQTWTYRKGNWFLTEIKPVPVFGR